VAYRYFATEERKFIIGDAPGHEQYTRNMVTAASSADAAVVLVDATKLDWKNPSLALLPQTRRHSLLVHLLRVHSLVFAVNKLDAVEDPRWPGSTSRARWQAFAQAAGIPCAPRCPCRPSRAGTWWMPMQAGAATRPHAAASAGRAAQHPADTALPLAFPVQWVEKFSSSSDTSQGRRVFWGRVAAGTVAPGTAVQIFPSGQLATVAQVLDHARRPKDVPAGTSAGIILDREVDVSRGDWILAAPTQPQRPLPTTTLATHPAATPAWPASRELRTTVAWMDDEPLVAGRVYWALHGHRWVKAKVQAVVHKLNINTLAEEAATQLDPNAIGHVELLLQEAIPAAPFTQARVLGSLILVDTASHKTAGAVLVN
jgi:sulfate adenylyltransferase subunit 1